MEDILSGVWQTIKAMYIADTFSLTVRAILPSIIMVFIVYLISRRSSEFRASRNMQAFIIVIVITITMLSPIELAIGSGWRINGDTMYMRAVRDSADIKINSMEIGFVDTNGEWRPETHINATSSGLLSVGKYALKNKKRALVFIRYPYSKVLLIYANQNYYMIGYRDVNTLYEELLKLGAKEKHF